MPVDADSEHELHTAVDFYFWLFFFFLFLCPPLSPTRRITAERDVRWPCDYFASLSVYKILSL